MGDGVEEGGDERIEEEEEEGELDDDEVEMAVELL